MNISTGDFNYSEWVTSANCLSKNRRLNFQLESCNVYDEVALGNTNELRRLGSDSIDAEVFLVRISGVDMACKVLPVVNNKSHSKNQEEIGIAMYLSNKVRAKKSQFFPLVFFNDVCEDTMFHLTSKFRTPSEKAAVVEYVLSEISNSSQKKRFNQLCKSMDVIDDIKFCAADKGIIVPDHVPVPSYIMCSELAWGDVGEYLKGYGSSLHIEIWQSLLLKMFCAIRDLHNFKVIHNDLHLGNFLVLISEEGLLTPLIHDFGHSQRVDVWTIDETSRDFESMVYALVDKHRLYHIPEETLNKLRCVTELITSHNSTGPLFTKIINFWERW